MHHFLDLLKELGPVGVLILSMVESAGIPNPGGTDFLLLFITAARPEDAVLTAALAVVGSLVGSLFFFELLRRGGEKFLAKYTASGRGLRFRRVVFALRHDHGVYSGVPADSDSAVQGLCGLRGGHGCHAQAVHAGAVCGAAAAVCGAGLFGRETGGKFGGLAARAWLVFAGVWRCCWRRLWG